MDAQQTPTPDLPPHINLGLALGTLLLFILYLLTLCPTLHWLDSGELTAGALHLSVPHPPGEPMWVLLTKGLMLLPLGDLAYRANLSSAIAGALTFPATYYFFTGWIRRPLPASAHWALLFTALAPSLTYPLWVQSVRAEVYAHHLALTLATLAALGRASSLRPRMWMLAGLLGGLTAAIHPLLAALSLGPAIVITAILRGLPRGLALGMTASTAFLGLSTYLLLPIRTMAGASMPWGMPDNATRFMDVLLARIFHHNFSPPTADTMAQNLQTLVESITYSTGWTIPFAALAGLVALALSRRVALAVLAVVIIGATFWSIIPQNLVFSTNVDLHGYLTIVHVILWGLTGALVIGLTAMDWAQKAPYPHILPAFIMGFLALSAALVQGPDASRADNRMARQHARVALDSTPQGGLLLTSGNNTMFGVIYMREVEGWRPDLQVVHRTLAGHKWYQRFRLKTPRPIIYERIGMALQGPREFLSFGTAAILEARDRDLYFAHWLCPTGPDPGWGFYRLVRPGTCPPAWLRHEGPGLARHFEAHPGDVESRLVKGMADEVRRNHSQAYIKNLDALKAQGIDIQTLPQSPPPGRQP